MKARFFGLRALFTATVAALSFNASAGIIDDFSLGNGSATDGVDGAGAVWVDDLFCGATCIGGWRDLFADRISGGLPGNTSSTVTSGAYSFSNDALVNGLGGLRYNGFAGAGLGGIDLTAMGSAFVFDVLFADLGLTAAVTIEDTSAVSETFITSSAVQILSQTPVSIGFSNFSSVDLTSVNSLLFTFGSASVASVDLALGEISDVPAPATLAMLGLGLLLLSRRVQYQRA